MYSLSNKRPLCIKHSHSESDIEIDWIGEWITKTALTSKRNIEHYDYRSPIVPMRE